MDCSKRFCSDAIEVVGWIHRQRGRHSSFTRTLLTRQ
jgi:hypothetical protein